MTPSADQQLVLAVTSAGLELQHHIERSLSHTKGISFAEYRLLRSLADAPEGQASRVALAAMVGLSPSGVTRALRPLEKLGFVATAKHERDARLALAQLTDAGAELVSDASGVIDDVAEALIERAPRVDAQRADLLALLTELAGD